jgi:hypothetical protein
MEHAISKLLQITSIEEWKKPNEFMKFKGAMSYSVSGGSFIEQSLSKNKQSRIDGRQGSSIWFHDDIQYDTDLARLKSHEGGGPKSASCGTSKMVSCESINPKKRIEFFILHTDSFSYGDSWTNCG